MSISAFFGDLNTQIKSEIYQAKKSLIVAVAWITLDIYKDTFLELSNRGVSIKILLADSKQNRKQKKIIDELNAQGLDLKFIKMPRNWNFMHHKFAIIDEVTVLNGSFNWSRNAEKSFENLLVIKNEPDIVRAFMLEYSKIEKLDHTAIKSLQKLERCSKKNCSGKKFNILVFSEHPDPITNELWGDVIQLCSECVNEDEYVKIERGVQDPQLHNLLNSYELLKYDYSQRYKYNRHLDIHLTGYKVRDVMIHAIGVVSREYYYPDNEAVFTRILWKNSFVDSVILDMYENDFDVLYEITTTF